MVEKAGKESHKMDNQLLVLLNTLPAIIIKLNSRGIIQFVNKYFTEETGFKPKEAIGQNFYSLFSAKSKNKKKAPALGSLKNHIIEFIEFKNLAPTVLQLNFGPK